MRLHHMIALTFILLALFSMRAQAQDFSISVTESAELPKNNFYVQFGEYVPAVSTDKSIQDYYDVFYGKKKNDPYMITFGWDWYFLDNFGLLGVTTQFGSWRAHGSSRVCYDDTLGEEVVSCNSTNINSSAEGNDTTSLSILPISMGLVYRLDALKRSYNIPFVPYIKGALQYFLWSNYGGTDISRINGEKGQGGTAGYHVAAGLAMALSWIEPGAAARGRATSGIYDSYLYAEWNKIKADHFGKKNRFDMSNQQINFGLAVELF